jgi:hypothetical protein
MSLTEKLFKLLTDEWKGKKFVYRSKYGGEVIGEIESAFVTNLFTMDPKSSKNLNEAIQTKTSKCSRQGDKPNFVKVNEEERYTAMRPVIHIRSTNGQVYELNEIYIITKSIFGDA